MAIYHCSVKMVKRSSGRSATAASAYRSGSCITDKRTGEKHDYSKKSDVDFSYMNAPIEAPEWMVDRETLWNHIEQLEKRKDAQLAREVVIALPKELNPDQQLELVNNYTRDQFIKAGMVCDIAVHGSKSENPHAHILLTTRSLEENGFGKKNREWNNKKLLNQWREKWQEHSNHSLQKHGIDTQIDHRSLKNQGIDRLPEIHVGVTASHMEQKGKATERGQRNNEIKEINAGIINLQQERERRQKAQAQQQERDKLTPENIEKTFEQIHDQSNKKTEQFFEKLAADRESTDRAWSAHLRTEPKQPEGLFSRFKRKQYEKDKANWEAKEKKLRSAWIKANRKWEDRQSDHNVYRNTEQAFKTLHPELHAERERLKELEREKLDKERAQQRKAHEKARQRSRRRGHGRGGGLGL